MFAPALVFSAISLAVAVFAGCSANSDSTSAVAAATPTTTFKRPPTGTPDAPEQVDPTDNPDAAACSGAPGSFYALTAARLSATDQVPLCRVEGQVLLVVNTASNCGYTPEYAPLEAIYEKYRAQGFTVLGFPSKTFNQELGTDQDVSSFCTSEYKITFPMFTIGNVNAPDQQPVYTWLKAQPGMAADVAWNFEKFLISRHGQIVKRILTATEPDDPEVTGAIEAELAKP